MKKSRRLAAAWYTKAAEQSHAPALCNLGECYRFGRGVPRDKAKAVELYRRSAAQGNRVAMFNLGECYEKGTGVPKDKAEALAWYQQSAGQGYEEAKKRVARLTNKPLKWLGGG